LFGWTRLITNISLGYLNIVGYYGLILKREMLEWI
jgi:hypothetical protein